MAKLNAVVAAEQTVRNRAQRRVTDLYHQLKKAPLFTGLSRTYRPRDDEGEQLPAESTRVQLNAEDVLKEIAKAWTPLWDTVLTKDVANMKAAAAVEIDGQRVTPALPVTYLLFLEKQLGDLRTAITSLPLLDPSERWTWSAAANAWVTEPVTTTRTKKIPRNHVKAEATERHPAQVEVFTEDVVVGYWDKIVYSGAVPATRQQELLERLEKLIIAVKHARETANSAEAESWEIGDDLFAHLLG